MVSEIPPYVGPRPFKREDEPFFFARDREGNDLVSLIISHSEVLLYAQSGAGKTSLINTKLWTLLENEDLEVLPLARVQGPPSLPKSTIKNIYVFNTLVKWAPKTATAEELAGMTLREFLKRREQPIDKEGLPKPFVAIFDQFEELFTSYPECWEQRRDFFLQVRDALDADPRMRALFAMREDYVAAIDQYATIMPEKFRVRFHLENLREPQAVEAIKGPLTRSPTIRHFGKDVAETLARELMKVQVETASGRAEPITGEFVEPVQLQVVCQRLWRDLKPEDTEITLTHLETISVEKALLSFYEESIRDVARDTGINEATLRSWFEQKLVTPAGTRGMVFRGETQTEGMPNSAVDALDELHVIRSELRDGRRWYELTHDRFIESIQKSRQKLLLSLQAGAEETRQKLEARASDWVSLGRKKSGLLRGVELLETQSWLDSPDAAALGSSEKLLALVEASRADVQERSARRQRRWLIALGAACFMTLLTSGYALYQRKKVQRLLQETEEFSKITLARNLAEESLKYRQSDLSLALLLNLEASRSADEINPKTPLQAEAKTSLLAAVKGGLVGGLVFSPHLRKFLQGHTETVRSVAFSPDGKMLATGGYDTNLILWGAEGYPLGPPLSGHTDAIYSVAFSPDGKKVASCGIDGSIIFWDVEKHERIKNPVPLGAGRTYSVAFSPDGNTLACATESGSIILYDIGRESISHLPKQHTGKVYCVAFSPKDNKLASAGEDKKILFWNFKQLKVDGTTIEDTNEVFSIAFSPDGKTLASGDRDNNVTLWDVAKRVSLGSPMTGHTNAVFSVAFSPDGKTLASSSTDKTIRRWDVATRKQLGEPLTGSSQQVYSVAFNANGKTLASGAERGVVVLWDITNKPILAERVALGDAIFRMAVTKDGKTMALGDLVGNITVVTESLNETFKAHETSITSLAFNADGTTLASASYDGTIQLHTWNGKTWNSAPRSLPKGAEPIKCIAFNPIDNTILASGGDDGSITFWDLSSGKPSGTPLKAGGKVNTLAFSPDGKTLASGSENYGDIIIWDVARREQLGLHLSGHTDGINSVVFSPSGKLLASGGKNMTVILWDVDKRQARNVPFQAHTGHIKGLAFSPDEKVLASVSYDKSIILWDVAASELIGPLVTEDKNDIDAVAFGPNGVLISAGRGLTYWDVRLESLRSNAEQIVGRNLTPDEWKRFLGNKPYRPTSLYGSLKEADTIALHGDIQQARKLFTQVVGMAAENGDAVVNNQVAWYGTLDNLADIVLPACSRAIELAKDEDKPLYRDTRGVVLAITRKFPEAIQDFEAFVIWLKDTEKRYSEEKTKRGKELAAECKKMREERETWIALLKSDRNPFDARTLMNLRREGAAFEGE